MLRFDDLSQNMHDLRDHVDEYADILSLTNVIYLPVRKESINKTCLS